MAVLVTGAAGFIGFHVAKILLARGETVIGVDNLNSYYIRDLKLARLAQLTPEKNFTFLPLDISDIQGFANAMAGRQIRRVVHLAAQPGVRHSITHPFDYVSANLTGHMVVLEFCRHADGLEHLVYASSSSVYGGSTDLPFSESQPVDRPVSLYAATKKANELMSHTYAHLYGLPQTGLRFFTVYGPWGRPDMAFWLFAEAIWDGKPLTVFNNGDMQRDYTYIDDIAQGVVACLDHVPAAAPGQPPAKVYNIGNSKPEPLMELIHQLEHAIGKKAVITYAPMQPGDVKATLADMSLLEREVGFRPRIPLSEGIPRFVDWYRGWRGRNSA